MLGHCTRPHQHAVSAPSTWQGTTALGRQTYSQHTGPHREAGMLFCMYDSSMRVPLGPHPGPCPTAWPLQRLQPPRRAVGREECHRPLDCHHRREALHFHHRREACIQRRIGTRRRPAPWPGGCNVRQPRQWPLCQGAQAGRRRPGGWPLGSFTDGLSENAVVLASGCMPRTDELLHLTGFSAILVVPAAPAVTRPW